MDSVTTGIILKNLRLSANLSIPNAINILRKDYSIKLNSRTLLNYEAGYGIPDLNHFLALCTVYHCQDILYTFGYNDEQVSLSTLSSEEQQIITTYRTLPTLEKNIVLGALGIKKELFQQKIVLLADVEILFKLILQKYRQAK